MTPPKVNAILTELDRGRYLLEIKVLHGPHLGAFSYAEHDGRGWEKLTPDQLDHWKIGTSCGSLVTAITED